MTDMPQTLPDADALTDFLDDLRDAGYSIGVAQYIAAHDLLLALAAQGASLATPETLRRMLGPLLCSTPTEQDDFQGRFDQWMVRAGRTARPVAHAGAKPAAFERELIQIEQQSRRWWRWGLIALAAIILVGLLVLGVQMTNTTPETVPAPTPAPAPAQPTPEPTPQDQPGIAWYWWVGGGVLLLGLAGVIMYRIWWYRRANQFLERQATTDHPDITTIALPDNDDEVLPTMLLVRIAQNFRRRVAVPSTDLDIPRTVEASVAQGGWFTPVYGVRQVRPEYLVLIDRAHHRDHQAHFVDTVITRLRDNEVFCTVYSFDGDPRVCIPAEGSGPPRTLQDLARRYADHRLVIFSDAHRLFNPSSGDLAAWTDQFAPWAERAILTPVAVGQWSYPEQALAQEFVVLPATAEGLTRLTERLHRSGTALPLDGLGAPLPQMLRMRPQRWVSRDAPPPAAVDEMLRALRPMLLRVCHRRRYASLECDVSSDHLRIFRVSGILPSGTD